MNPAVADDLQREAEILTRYLVRTQPDAQEVGLYARAVEELGPHGPDDRRLWRWMMAHPRLLPVFDAGLARLDPRSVERHRILMMLAILETSPRHADSFLTRPFGLWTILMMFGGVVFGFVRVAFGVVLLRCLRLR